MGLELFDRYAQIGILEALSDFYPTGTDKHTASGMLTKDVADFNWQYLLDEHMIVTIKDYDPDRETASVTYRITSAGINHLLAFREAR